MKTKRVARWRKLREFLEEVTRRTAQRDAWRESELAMALADLDLRAKRMGRYMSGWTDAQVGEFLYLCSSITQRSPEERPNGGTDGQRKESSGR